MKWHNGAALILVHAFNQPTSPQSRNLDLLREMFRELELHVQLHGIELRDYFQVLTEEQYWIRNALPGREDRDSLVTFEPPTAEELAYQKELKAEMKRIEEEAYEYVMKQDTDEIEKMKKETVGFEGLNAFEKVAKIIEKRRTEPKQPKESRIKNLCIDCSMRAEDYGVERSMKKCSKVKFCKVCNSAHITAHTWKEQPR